MERHLQIPDLVKSIMQQVLKHNFEIYLVGGVVRDFLRGEETLDFDFATNALPSEIKKIFSEYHILDYGEEHGTIAIHHRGFLFEITTYRVESKYSDGRRPDDVEFVNDLKLDLDRRDFTINALAADINGKIIDYHGGHEDFQNQIIRCVGDPIKRFQEDSLRLLRAVRFALRLDFMIDPQTLKAMRKSVSLLLTHHVSGERIQSELAEIMEYTSRCFHLLNKTKLLSTVFKPLPKRAKEALLESVKQLEDHHLNSWGVFLYYYHMKYSDMSMIFSQYPGYGNFMETLYLNVADFVKRVVSHENIYVEDLLREVRLSYQQLKKFPEFNFEEFVTRSFLIVDSICSHDNGYFDQNLINTITTQFPVTLPVTGQYFVDLGYQGKEIGICIELFEILATYRKLSQTELDIIYSELFSDFVDLAYILELISFGHSVRSESEIQEVVTIVRLLLEVKGDIVLVCSNSYHEAIVGSILDNVSPSKKLEIKLSNHDISLKKLQDNNRIILR